MTAVVLVSALTTHHAEPERPSAASIYMRNLTRAAQSGFDGIDAQWSVQTTTAVTSPWTGPEEIPSIKKPLLLKPSVVWWMFPVLSAASFNATSSSQWGPEASIHLSLASRLQLRENSPVICSSLMNPSIIWSGLSPANWIITNKRISLKRVLYSIQSESAPRRILRLKQHLWGLSPPPNALTKGSRRQRDVVTSTVTPCSSSARQRGWKDYWLNLPFLNGPLSSSGPEAPGGQPHLSLPPSSGHLYGCKNRWVQDLHKTIWTYWAFSTYLCGSCCGLRHV